MTRQLFPSPSQGALICEGGGEEGQLAAAQASVGAGLLDPAPHSGVWTRGFALFLCGFWTLWGILLPQAELSLQRTTEPASRSWKLQSWGAGSPLLLIFASEAPSNQGLRASGSLRRARRLSREREGNELRSPRVGSWAGVSVVELVCSLFLSGVARNRFSDQRILAVLKVPGRDRGDSAPLGI